MILYNFISKQYYIISRHKYLLAIARSTYSINMTKRARLKVGKITCGTELMQKGNRTRTHIDGDNLYSQG